MGGAMQKQFAKKKNGDSKTIEVADNDRVAVVKLGGNWELPRAVTDAICPCAMHSNLVQFSLVRKLGE